MSHAHESDNAWIVPFCLLLFCGLSVMLTALITLGLMGALDGDDGVEPHLTPVVETAP